MNFSQETTGQVYLQQWELLFSSRDFGFQPFPDVLFSKQTVCLLSKIFS